MSDTGANVANADDQTTDTGNGENQVDTSGVLDSKDQKDDKVDNGVLSDDDIEGAKPGAYTHEVPDQYEVGELPEGVSEDDLDQEKIEEFKAFAKEHNLSQAQFQAAMKLDYERSKAANEAWAGRVQGWAEAARTDALIGGENFAQNKGVIVQALQKFGDAELAEALKDPSKDTPGGLALGKHPAVLRLLFRAGKALGDPKLVTSDTSSADAQSQAALKRMYPSMYNDD